MLEVGATDFADLHGPWHDDVVRRLLAKDIAPVRSPRSRTRQERRSGHKRSGGAYRTCRFLPTMCRPTVAHAEIKRMSSEYAALTCSAGRVPQRQFAGVVRMKRADLVQNLHAIGGPGCDSRPCGSIRFGERPFPCVRCDNRVALDVDYRKRHAITPDLRSKPTDLGTQVCPARYDRSGTPSKFRDPLDVNSLMRSASKRKARRILVRSVISRP